MALLVSAQRLPGINFETPVGITDLGFQFDTVFATEQRNRLQLVMGSYLGAGASYGIVDEFNPNTAVAGASRPFVVTANLLNSLNCDVTPGVVVTKSGNIIVVEDTVLSITLVPPPDSPVANTSFVVYLEYLTVGDDTTATLTKYNNVEDRRRVFAPIEQVLKVAKLTDYQNPGVFTPDRLNDTVVLAVVKVVSTVAITIDMLNNVNTFNRPWFSPVAIKHESELGTGSSLVPHSLGLSDLSQGALTLYQQELPFGHVLSKDYDVPGCPGKLNAELITSPRLYTDATGFVTGTVNQLYVRLMAYPQRLLAARSNDDALNDMAVSVLPNSNILLFPANEIFPTNGFTLYYTSSSAVEPPVAVLTNDILQFGVPDASKELFITGGKGFNTLESPNFQVSNAGPFPREYSVFIDGSKQFLLSPQILVCAKYITTGSPFGGVGFGVNLPDFSMYGPARISVGLTQVVAIPTVNAGYNVTIQLIGKNTSGSVVTENIVFDNTNYFPVPIPTNCGFAPNSYVTDPPQYLTSNTVFASLTSWQVTTRSNDAAETVVGVWAELKPPTTPQLNDILPLAVVRWNGQAICNDLIRDVRPVSATLEKSEFMDRMLANLNTLIAGMNINSYISPGPLKPAILAAEDFNNPHWLDQLRSKRNKFADGLRSYFVPELVPTFGASFDVDPDTGAEYYYTRAIELPLATAQQTIFIQLFGSKFESLSAANLLQYRLSTIATPAVWTAWAAAPPLNSNLTRHVDITGGGPYLKVQFRFILHDCRGFFALMTGT